MSVVCVSCGVHWELTIGFLSASPAFGCACGAPATSLVPSAAAVLAAAPPARARGLLEVRCPCPKCEAQPVHALVTPDALEAPRSSLVVDVWGTRAGPRRFLGEIVAERDGAATVHWFENVGRARCMRYRVNASGLTRLSVAAAARFADRRCAACRAAGV